MMERGERKGVKNENKSKFQEKSGKKVKNKEEKKQINVKQLQKKRNYEPMRGLENGQG